MTKAILVVAALLAVAACSEEAGSRTSVDRDTLTRRQKDSIFGAMPLPGSQGIRGALDAADAASDRAARHDTIG